MYRTSAPSALAVSKTAASIPQTVRGPGEELAEISRGNLVPAVQNDDVLADRLDIREEVARQKQIATGRVRDLPDEVEHLRPTPRVEARRGLVEDVQLRVVDHRLRELHFLFHARRVFRDLAVPLLVDPHELEHVVGAAHRGVPVEPADASHVRNQTDARHVRDQAIVLGHVADPLPHGEAIPDIEAEDLRGARGRTQETQEEPQERRLAGAVRADESDRALGDRDAEVVDRADVAEDFRQTGGLNEGHPRLLVAGVRSRAERPPIRVLGFEPCGASAGPGG